MRQRIIEFRNKMRAAASEQFKKEHQSLFPAELGWEKLRKPTDQQVPYKIPQPPTVISLPLPRKPNAAAGKKKVEIEEIETSSPDGLSDDEESLLDWAQPKKEPTKIRLPEPLSAKPKLPPKPKNCDLTYTNYLRELKERPLSEQLGSAKVMRLAWFRKQANVVCLRFDAKSGNYPASLQGKLLQGMSTSERGKGLHVRPRVTLTDSQFDELFNQIANSDFWADKNAVLMPISEIQINSFSNLYDQNSLPMVDKIVVETWSNSRYQIAVPSINDPSILAFLTKQLDAAGLTPIGVEIARFGAPGRN